MEHAQIWLGQIMPAIRGWLMGYGPSILAALVVFVIGWIAARMAASLFGGLMRRSKLDATVTGFLKDLIRFLLMTFVILAALNQLGVQTASIIAILGASALAVGLAIRGQVSSLAAGIMLLVVRPFKSGDLVEVGGKLGTVTSIGMISTVLAAPDGLTLTIPNRTVFDGVIINYTAKGTRRIDLVIGVSYASDLHKAKEVLAGVLAADPRVLAEPAARVDVLELGDSSVNFGVRPWVQTGDFWDTRCDLMREIKLALDREGVDIPFPVRDVIIRKAS